MSEFKRGFRKLMVPRMAEASAKMHLREYVRVDDVDLAISVAVGSFLSAQKLSVRRSLERVSDMAVQFTFSDFLLGIPQVPLTCTGPRGTARFPPWTTCQG